MFANCTSLTSIDLSNFYFDNSNNMTNIFFNCKNLQTIIMKGYLPDIGVSYKIGNIVGISLKVINNQGTQTNNYNEMFKNVISLKKMDLFDLNINLTSQMLENIIDLEECLYYKYDNICYYKDCSKYMGFHYCGNCLNENNEYYCTKIINEKYYDFYYLENQSIISYTERECYWDYYKLYEYCEIYLEQKSDCVKCRNNKGY
jgi:hypothetical protein